jgi:hypothetical protein
VWAGKYPIPLKAKESLSPSFTPSDFDDIDNLFARLVNVLETENPEPTVHFA